VVLSAGGKTAADVEAAEALLHTLSKLSGKLRHIYIYVYDLETYVGVYILVEPYLYVRQDGGGRRGG